MQEYTQWLKSVGQSTMEGMVGLGSNITEEGGGVEFEPLCWAEPEGTQQLN